MTITREQIKAARNLLGWSQQDMAGHIGVSKATIGNFEKGKRRPEALQASMLRNILERAGVEFTNGGQPGVRLPRKTRKRKLELDDWQLVLNRCQQMSSPFNSTLTENGLKLERSLDGFRLIAGIRTVGHFILKDGAPSIEPKIPVRRDGLADSPEMLEWLEAAIGRWINASMVEEGRLPPSSINSP